MTFVNHTKHLTQSVVMDFGKKWQSLAVHHSHGASITDGMQAHFQNDGEYSEYFQ